MSLLFGVPDTHIMGVGAAKGTGLGIFTRTSRLHVSQRSVPKDHPSQMLDWL
jgi:hypothetical protein